MTSKQSHSFSPLLVIKRVKNLMRSENKRDRQLLIAQMMTLITLTLVRGRVTPITEAEPLSGSR